MSYIKIEVPNDDHIALRAFGKALEEMALAHGAESKQQSVWVDQRFNIHPSAEAALAANNRIKAHGAEPVEETRDAVGARLRAATEILQQAAPRMMQEASFDGEELQGKRKDPEVDTTVQQVEALANRADAMLQVAEQPFQGEAVPTTDKTGTPWDERIHSASKALNADGTWRLRRKPKHMDEEEWAMYVEEVTTAVKNGYPNEPLEIHGADDVEPPVTLEDAVNASIEVTHAGIAQEFGTGIANAAFTGDRNEPPVTPPGDDFHADAGAVTEQTVAGIPPIPVPPPVVVPPVTEDWTFPKLMTFLTERQGKIDVPTVNMLLAQDGIASLPELNAHPDKIGPFVARVKAHLGE